MLRCVSRDAAGQDADASTGGNEENRPRRLAAADGCRAGLRVCGDGQSVPGMPGMDGATEFWAGCFAAVSGYREALLAARLKGKPEANDTACVKNVVQ